MRNAYALLGLVWIIILAAIAWGFHNTSTGHQEERIQIMATSTLRLTSETFENGSVIPSRFTCDDRKDLNPPLSFSGVPSETKSLALIMDDPDVPKVLKPDGVFDHWVLYNIPPATTGIAEGSSVGVVGTNGAGAAAYTGPCPPKQYEPSQHRYVFRLYALDTLLALSGGASKQEVLDALRGHILAEAELTGVYKRQ